MPPPYVYTASLAVLQTLATCNPSRSFQLVNADMGGTPSYPYSFVELPFDNPNSVAYIEQEDEIPQMSDHIKKIRKILADYGEKHDVNVRRWNPMNPLSIKYYLKGLTSMQYRWASHAFAEISRECANMEDDDVDMVRAYSGLVSLCRKAYNVERNKELMLPPYKMPCDDEELDKKYIESYRTREYLRTLQYDEKNKIRQFLEKYKNKLPQSAEEYDELTAVFKIMAEDYFKICRNLIEAANTYRENATNVALLAANKVNIYNEIDIGYDICISSASEYRKYKKDFDTILQNIEIHKPQFTISNTSL